MLPIIWFTNGPEGFTDTPTHYCPGCTHGVAHRLIAEVLEEMGVLERTIGVAPVGCSVFAYNYFDTDFVEAPHGRAPAMATGIKRVLPDRVVFSLPGRWRPGLDRHGRDRPCCRARREHHRDLHQQRQLRHDRRTDGADHPARHEDHLLAQRPGCGNAGLSRSACPKCCPRWMAPATWCGAPCTIRRTSAWQRKPSALAFETQVHGLGFSMVELLSTCPTNWNMTPVESLKFVEDKMVAYFPLGDYKVRGHRADKS